MLEAERLTKCYSAVPAVEDLNFCLAPGQVLGCVGPNGSGKSTAVKMLTGLLEPTRGHVFFRGVDISNDLVGYRRRLGYVPEEAHLYPYLSGREYLEMVGILRGLREPQLSRKIEALLELFSLSASRHAALASYSKGMRQRVLLIAGLLDNPELLILDEPLSGLDVSSALILKKLIKTLGQQGKAVFYCSHVLEVVEKVCSHLLILRQARVVACGSTAEILPSIGHANLESTFHHLVEDVDSDRIARDIVEVIGNV